MIYLLDVNVLVALLDPDHMFHDRAHDWFEQVASPGWATCPLTENGVIRILAHVRYPNGPGTPAAAAEMLRVVSGLPGHVFWPDEISLVAAPHVRSNLLATPAQVTDSYLLALAAHRNGMLATFDRRLSAAAVLGGAEALLIID